jgi:hypothetical protein
MQACYLAVPGSVEKVVILEEGLGGTEPKFIPENPVVVTLVDGCYSFVASKDSLFDDPNVAQTEAERLRVEEAENRRKARPKMIDDKDRPTPEEGTSIGEGATESNLVFILDRSAPHNTIPIEVVDEPTILDVEAESSSEVGEDGEPEVSDTCDTVAPASKFARPQDIVNNIQRVLGGETLSVVEIYKRLSILGLMPLTNKPTEYLRYIFSKNRDIFDRPERGIFCLREGNPFRVPLEQQEIEVVEETSVQELEEVQVEEVPVEEKSAVKRRKSKSKKNSKKKSKKASVKQDLPLNTVKRVVAPKSKQGGADYSTWLGESMVQTNAFGSRFSGSYLRLLEQKRGDLWVCEITVVGLGLFLAGTSKRRDFARKEAQKKMEAAINLLNIIKSKAINR